MDILVIINTIFTVLTYATALFFLIATIRAFCRSKNAQDAVVFCIIMVPFVLRLLRLK